MLRIIFRNWGVSFQSLPRCHWKFVTKSIDIIYQSFKIRKRVVSFWSASLSGDFSNMIMFCETDSFWPIFEKNSDSHNISYGLDLSLSEWQLWSTWNRCSKTCGSGTRRRTRSCTNGPGCSGLNEDTEICNATKCPGII